MSSSETSQNDNLMSIMAGRSDAEHLVALDRLSRKLEKELYRLECCIELINVEQHIANARKILFPVA